MHWYTCLLSLLGLAASGCGAYEVLVGCIMHDEGEYFSAPSVVSAGEPFVVEFSTWGSSTCVKPHHEDIEWTADRITITPYDRSKLSDACTADLSPIPRQVEITVGEPGAYVLELRGCPVSPLVDEELVTVEHDLLVMPSQGVFEDGAPFQP